MAGVLRTAPGWVRHALASTPLRVRLVGAVLLLVIAALVGSGAAASATMRGYLLTKIDEQLADAASHAGDAGPFPGHRGGPDEHDGSDTGGRLPSVFVNEVLGPYGHPVQPLASNLIDSTQPLPLLPAITAAQSSATGPRYFTVSARSGGQDWRVYAEPVRLSDGRAGTLLVAQSLSDVSGTVTRLDELLLIIGAIAALVIAGVGYFIVRANLRPLGAVEGAAAQIAAGDLSHRVPQPDPRTEVGHLAGALNTMLGDIETAFTQRAASEQAARESSERAQRSEERMRRFVADASHELRTPLTTVRGFAELYRQGAVASADETRTLMARIESEAEHMGVLVEDLLLLARLDQERPLAREPVDMLTVAGEAVHTAQALASERPVRLHLGNTDPPPIVCGDEARLRQVITNLLANALKYSPGDTAVEVKVETVDRSNVRISVRDFGPGIEPEAAARIFERFYRADAARNRHDGGTGLGLAIVAAIVAAHHGHVKVDTAPGDGSTFTVELPLLPG